MGLLTAQSKAQRARQLRGRPRIHGQKREPNGRISRAKKPQEPIDKLAIEARARHFGLDYDEAKNPMAASYIGRLVLRGQKEGLSQSQYDAAVQFLALRNDYQRTILSPGAHYEQNSATIISDDMEAYSAWVARVHKRYFAALKAIQEAQFDNSHENLYAALQYIVMDDLQLPHLIGATRMALNALARHFTLHAQQK